jgi:hypothetical protein
MPRPANVVQPGIDWYTCQLWYEGVGFSKLPLVMKLALAVPENKKRLRVIAMAAKIRLLVICRAPCCGWLEKS